MSSPAERFDDKSSRLRNVEGNGHGPALHEYTGELVETGEAVRILTLAPTLADDDSAVEAFTGVGDEWANASANANVVTVSDRGTEPRPWLATPDTGETLDSIGTELPPEAVGTVITETAEALRTVGLYNAVHGHLSPGDVRISGVTDGELSVRVGGFGLEQAVGERDPTPYTAPELLEASTQPSQRTDVYGLGAVAYFALTGRPPVEGDLTEAIRDGPPAPPSEYSDGVSPALDDVVMGALSASPEERYETPYAFQRAFQSAFDPDAFGVVADDGSEAGDSSGGSATATAGDGTEPADAGAAAGGGDESEPDEAGDAVAGGGDETEPDDDGTEPDSEGGGLTRRALTGAVGVTAVGAAAGGLLYLDSQGDGHTDTDQPAPQTATESDSPPGQPDFGGYLDGVDNYDGTVVDARGQDTVTVEVGTEANGGAFGFGPPAIHVDNGTTVQWAWTGDGGGHNVVSEDDGPLDSGAAETEPGVNYEHTFEEDGVYNYYCVPHESLQMKGAVVVGDDYPTAPVVESTDADGNFGGHLDNVSNYDGTVADARGRDTVTVEVGVEANGGAYGFGPPAVHVDNGATVQWEWTGNGGGHNIAWMSERLFDSGSPVASAGVNYRHTFEEDGVYLYRCAPHEGLGMKGAVVVGDDYPRRDGAGSTAPSLSRHARTGSESGARQ